MAKLLTKSYLLNRKRINTYIENAVEYNKILYLLAPIAWGKTTALRNYIDSCSDKIEWFDLKDQSITIDEFYCSSDDFRKIIVLDNIEEVKDKKILSKLVRIIKGSSESCKFIMLGRIEPAVNFSEFIVKGQISVLTMDDLSFTQEELEEFYLENGLELNSVELRKIFEYTEGWPGVMAIVLMLLKLNYSVDDLIYKSNEYIENFIDENIWSRLDLKCKNFFMNISLFKELPIDLFLELVEQSKVKNIFGYFLCGKANSSYKMNTVFRNFLKNKAEIHLSNESEIYERIGEWFEKNNYEIEAIDSYFKANKIQRILDMLEKNYDNHIRISNVNYIGSYLKKSINKTSDYSAVICTLMAIFEIINFRFDEGEIWYKKLIKIKNSIKNNIDEYVNISLKIIYVKLNMVNGKYKEIPNIYASVLNEIPMEKFPLKELSLTEGLPSILRGIKDYSNIGRHYKVIKKILIHKLSIIYGDDGLNLLQIGHAELEYEKSNLNTSIIILSEQLFNFSNNQIDILFTLTVVKGKVLLAMGDIDKCEENMDILRQEIVKNKAFYLLKNYNSVYSRIALLKGNISNVEKFLVNHNECENVGITCLEMHQYLTKVRIYIATRKYERAIILLQKLYHVNLKHEYILNIIECCVLEAICLYRSNDMELALQKIDEALKLAQPYSYVRIFADEGENAYIILNKYAKSKHRDIREEYLKRILVETRAFAQLYPKYLEADTEVTNFKITKTELEILHLLNEGMSNSDICDYLDIKIDTVKFHTRNLYAKLGVKSRLKAVQVSKLKKIIK